MNLEQVKKDLQHIIDTWKVVNEEEYSDFISYREDQVASKTNEFASSSKNGELKDARHLMEIPTTLARTILHYYPNIFTDRDESDWFLKEFPIFRIPKKL